MLSTQKLIAPNNNVIYKLEKMRDTVYNQLPLVIAYRFEKLIDEHIKKEIDKLNKQL